MSTPWISTARHCSISPHSAFTPFLMTNPFSISEPWKVIVDSFMFFLPSCGVFVLFSFFLFLFRCSLFLLIALPCPLSKTLYAVFRYPDSLRGGSLVRISMYFPLLCLSPLWFPFVTLMIPFAFVALVILICILCTYRLFPQYTFKFSVGSFFHLVWVLVDISTLLITLVVRF